MIILGIETSCDETAVALVTDQREILTHKILSQTEQHETCGGVIPEVAARAHLDHLDGLIDESLTETKVSLKEIDGIAVTAGPGLIGGLIVGVTTAKIIALTQNIPFIAVNHLAAHALTVRLTHQVDFPYLTLLVSGGHCQLLIVRSPLEFELLGETLDDAVGEAFDKTARLLDLPYPGGPPLEFLACSGNPTRFSFPRPLLHKKEIEFACSFSLSGLKTAVRQTVEKIKTETGALSDENRADCAASFQYTIGKILLDRLLNALNICRQRGIPLTAFVLSGGVAANLYLRTILEKAVEQEDLPFVAPPPALCTDNAVMIAWAGMEKQRLGRFDSLDFKPRPRWPLTDLRMDL